MQIGDAFVGVDHGQIRPLVVSRFDRRINGVLPFLRQGIDFVQYIAPAIACIGSQSIEFFSKCFEYGSKEGFDERSKQDGVRDLHHCCLEMQRKQDTLCLGVCHLLFGECTQFRFAQCCCVNDFSGLKGKC